MNNTEYPGSEEEISQIVGAAKMSGQALEIIGGGTRNGLGNPVEAETKISLEKHSGINLYEPDALTLVAKAGTALDELQAELKSNGQRLPFEPMHHQSLFATNGSSTIGGVVACNISGSRRIQAGACRDSLIGVRFVDGNGIVLKNGGRVMKNVTGLDLVKLLCGSHGTLGVISEVAFKVLPIAEREATLVIADLVVEEAMGVLSGALATPFDVTGAAYLPNPGGVSLTALRVEGFADQVDYRLGALRDAVAANRDVDIFEGKKHVALWQRVRDVEDFKNSDQPVWRISVKPGHAALVHKQVSEKLDAQFVFDWGGGLIWVAVDAANDAGANVIRDVASGIGGHAMLVRAPDQMRSSVCAFQPQSKRVAELSEAIRQKFDPAGILNPGRMTGVGD